MPTRAAAAALVLQPAGATTTRPAHGTVPYSQEPLLYAACAYAAGVVLARLFWRPEVWLIAAPLLLLAGAAFFLARGRERVATALALAVFAITGALNQELQANRALMMANRNDFAALTSGEDADVTAHVVRDGVFENSGAEVRQSVDLETEEEELSGKGHSLHFLTRLSIYSRGEQTEDTVENVHRNVTYREHIFRYGERLRFRARLKQPRNFADPG